jgi:hypothetical protein
VEGLTREVFARIRAAGEGNGLEEYVEPVIETVVRGYESSLRRNSYWIGLLTQLYSNGIEPDEYRTKGELVREVTPGGVASSVKRHLDFENYINVVYYHGT